MRPGSEEPFLLDTSAWLALMEGETGADEVERILREERVFLPFLVLLEVYYVSFREGGEKAADRRYALMKSLDVELLWEVDEPTLLTAGRFKALYKLSLADALIAAFAKTRKATLVHRDPEYEPLRNEVRQLVLPS